MALPTEDMQWPPAEIRPALDQMKIHDAWWVGDVDDLSARYRPRPIETPAQLNNGIIGTVSRMWYGKPSIGPSGVQNRLHVPVAADIATMSADLLFSEPPRFVFEKTATVQTKIEVKVDPVTQEETEEETTERTPTPEQETIEDLISTPRNHTQLLAAAEVASVLGACFLRLVWDEDIEDKVMLQAVHADNVWPVFRFGRLVSVTFWQTLGGGDGTGTVWRHLEQHEKGVIRHGLYKGTVEYLGTIEPLGSHSETEYLVDQINVEGDGISTGVEGLTACYIPNMLPNRKFRNKGQLTNYGRSDFDGIEDIFDKIDEVYTSWMRDIRLAKARLIVGAGVLENNGPGKGQSFDADREVFEEINIPGSLAGEKMIQAEQFEIRWQEHQETIKELTAVALRGAGYSVATFGEGSADVQETATKVKARERLTERTRDKKTNYFKSELGEFARTWMQLNSILFKTPWTDEIPEVRFPSESQTDPEALARTAQLMRDAQAASTQTLVRMLHPEWDGETVNEEVQRILDEVPTPVVPESLDTFDGGAGDFDPSARDENIPNPDDEESGS